MAEKAPPKPNPYPTPSRLQLMRDLAAGRLRHYQFGTPVTYDVNDRKVTAGVAEFVNADPPLADLGQPDEHNYSIVTLTPAGEAWLNTYGGTE